MRSTTVLPTAAVLAALLGCTPSDVPRADPSPPRSSSPSPVPSPTPWPAPSPPAPRSSSRSSSPPESVTSGTPRPAPSITVPEIRQPPRTSGLVRGADVSWPQCPRGMGIPARRSEGLPMPRADARFVVVGLTNGPGFTRNPCLADQVRWVRERALMAAAYAVTSFPDRLTLRRYADDGPFAADTRLGALRNVGYQQALANVASMQRAGLLTPVVWVDVEPVPDFGWSSKKAENAAVVVGAAQGYGDAGYGVGTYSTPVLWTAVVGRLELRLPEWRAAGSTSRAEALRRCRPDWSFQGGDAVLAQWVESSRDHDTTCPGVGHELVRWFHQY